MPVMGQAIMHFTLSTLLIMTTMITLLLVIQYCYLAPASKTRLGPVKPVSFSLSN